MSDKNTRPQNTKSIRIVTNVLKGAVKLFLRSQVSDIEDLDIDIQASDRQLLTGAIPKVSVFASRAVYQGLHLTSIQLTAENIRINIGSVLKGQPLKLLEVIPVTGKLVLDEGDLNASLTSALLSTALNDALIKLIPELSQKTKQIIWKKIILGHNQLTIVTNTDAAVQVPLEIGIALELVSGNKLKLTPIWNEQETPAIATTESDYHFHLGSDVDIEELMIIPGKLACCGRININP
jgi:LmeA-like phospholipid-binding